MTPHWTGQANGHRHDRRRRGATIEPTRSGAVPSTPATMASASPRRGSAPGDRSVDPDGPQRRDQSAKRSFSRPRRRSAHGRARVRSPERPPVRATKYVGVDTALTSSDHRSSALAASQAAVKRAGPGSTPRTRRPGATCGERHSRRRSARSAGLIRSNLYALWSSIRAGSDTSTRQPDSAATTTPASSSGMRRHGCTHPAPDAPGRRGLRHRILRQDSGAGAGERGGARLLGHALRLERSGNGRPRHECHSVDPPHCRTRIHLQGDIALATWQYYLATGDTAWLRSHWPILRGEAEFWASRATRTVTGHGRSSTSPARTSTRMGSTTACSRTAGGSLALRNATRLRRSSGRPAPPNGWTIAANLRMPFDERPDLLSVRRL